MSRWTYVHGMIKVEPMGTTQAHKRYILETVLAHLPVVTGSEMDMEAYIVELNNGCCTSCSHDEFGMRTNNLRDHYGGRTRKNGWLNINSYYGIVCDGAFRDREFDQTYRELIKWLTRLSKRVIVDEIIVKINDDTGKETIISDARPFEGMYEYPSWSTINTDGEPSWAEFMMWDRDMISDLPLKLAYKYYSDESIDKEMERRFEFADKR